MATSTEVVAYTRMKKYTKDDLKTLFSFLVGVATKWKKIGLQLGLDHGILNNIQHDHPHDVESCLMNAISTWLASDEESTSEKLAKALADETVLENRLAQKVLGNAATNVSSPSTDISSSNSTDGQEFPEQSIPTAGASSQDLSVQRCEEEVHELVPRRNTAGPTELKDMGEKATSQLADTGANGGETESEIFEVPAPRSVGQAAIKDTLKNLLFSLLLVLPHFLLMLMLLFVLYMPILEERQYSSSSVFDTLRNFSTPRNCSIYHGCLSLPRIEHNLVGKYNEIQEIIKKLSHPDVQVFGLVGESGVGKSSIAIHIGHYYQNQGKAVYYVSVDSLQVHAIVNLFSTNEHDEKISLQEWAQRQENETLVILDNMNERYWNFRAVVALEQNFIEILQENSRNIKILITTKKSETIKTKHFYYPKELNDTTCISFLQVSTTRANISNGHAGAICYLTEGIPLAIKLVARLLSSNILTVEQVLGKLVVSVDSLREYELEIDIDRIAQIQQVIWSTWRDCEESLHTDPSYIISYLDLSITEAIDLSFKFISTKCYYISLLLAKLRSFTTDIAKHFITNEMKPHLSDVEDCIHELYNRSLLEKYTILGQSGHKFPTRVRTYLERTKLNNDRLLKMFWKNTYFQENLRIECGGLDCDLVRTIWTWMPRMPQLNHEDISVLLTDFMPHINDELVLHILDISSYTDTVDHLEDMDYMQLQGRAIERLNCVSPRLREDKMVLLINLYENYTTCEVTDTKNYPKFYDFIIACTIVEKHNGKYRCRHLT